MTHLTSIAIERYDNTFALKENRKKLRTYTKKLEETVQERTHEVMATVQKLVETNLNLKDQIRITKLAKSDAITSKSIASEIAKNFPNGFVVVMDKDSKLEFAEGDAISQLGLKQILQGGMTVDDVTFFSEKRKTLIKENIKKTLAGQHLSFEVNYKGRYFAVNTAPLVDENNEITSALHVYTDITHQKEIEFTIQNALKKEQELNELKSRFISMASHEFRTPLSAILTSAILIGKQNGVGKEQKREKYVAQIEKNVKNLTVILNDFLSLSKLEEGKVAAIPEHFDLVSFSEILVKETTFLGLKNKQTINLTSPDDELIVRLDVKLLSHILNNLLSNASKYSPDGSRIDFNISQKGEKVILQITDQGIGIPEDEYKYLFGRFFRAKNATNIEGTGLGLNIVKQYTELMGGTIGFKSEINKGSTFWVELPI
jgi:signal transduction histidine kinase